MSRPETATIKECFCKAAELKKTKLEQNKTFFNVIVNRLARRSAGAGLLAEHYLYQCSLARLGEVRFMRGEYGEALGNYLISISGPLALPERV